MAEISAAMDHNGHIRRAWVSGLFNVYSAAGMSSGRYVNCRLWNKRSEEDTPSLVDSEGNKWVGPQQSGSKEGTIKYCQSKEASTPRSVIPWGNKRAAYREIMQGKRQVHIGKKDHKQPGCTSRRGQDLPWESQSGWQRSEITGESMFNVWLLAKPRIQDDWRTEQYSTCVPHHSAFHFHFYLPYLHSTFYL